LDEKTLEKLKRKMTGIEDVKETLNILLYSDAGIGKTTAAALSPKPLIINCEGGTMSLNKFKSFHKDLDIKVVKPESIKDLQDIFWYLKSGKHDRETVILDSLTEIQTMSMDEVLVDPKRDAKFDKDTPMLQDYGKNTNRMKKLVRTFRDLPMNVVFTCLAGEDKDENDGSVKILPELMPKLCNSVMGYVDVVGYMFTAGGKDDKTLRKILTQPKGKYKAKDRSGKLGMGMENPTLFEMLNKITDGAIEIPENLDKILEEIKKFD